MSNRRQPRTIPRLTGGPDKRTADLNNALYVIVEFVSPGRLATLAIMPTAAQLIAAVDLYLTCESNQELVAHAQALRTAAEMWVDGGEVPSGVFAAAKAILTVLGPEPPAGWDADDGYSSGAISQTEPKPRPEASEPAVQVSEQAEHSAQTVMLTINLAALLASPRLLQKATEMPSREHLLEHFDALVRVFSTGRASSPPAGVEATREAALRLRGVCARWTPGPEAPAEVQKAALALLRAFGVDEPPGGWDAFEGVEEA